MSRHRVAADPIGRRYAWIRYTLCQTPIGGIGHCSVATQRRGPWVGISDAVAENEGTIKRLVARAELLNRRGVYRRTGAFPWLVVGPIRRWPRRRMGTA